MVKPEDSSPLPNVSTLAATSSESSDGLETVPQERLSPSEQWPQLRQNEESDPKYIVNRPYYSEEKIHVPECDLPQAVDHNGHIYPEVISPTGSDDSIEKPQSAVPKPPKPNQSLYQRRKKWFIIGGLILLVIIVTSITVPVVLLRARDGSRGNFPEIQVVTVTVGDPSTLTTINLATERSTLTSTFPGVTSSFPPSMATTLTTTTNPGMIYEPGDTAVLSPKPTSLAIFDDPSLTTDILATSVISGTQIALLNRGDEYQPEITPAPAIPLPRTPPSSARRRKVMGSRRLPPQRNRGKGS
ncbi:hypothetical protein QBC43DRAFT_337650 [Cladorrhinum sp. PSN259]|nr:hypothetical protein QBC43DRAFT_337650 [Cladorrhinum sp. PSN259]